MHCSCDTVLSVFIFFAVDDPRGIRRTVFMFRVLVGDMRMLRKNFWFAVYFFLFTCSLVASEPHGGDQLEQLFTLHGIVADEYAIAKQRMRRELTSATSLVCGLGVYKYLRSRGMLPYKVAFECAGAVAAVHQSAGALHSFTIDPLVRLMPGIRRLRREKRERAALIMRYIDEHQVRRVDQLPPLNHLSPRSMKLALNALRRIHYGDVGTGTEWRDDLFVKRCPNLTPESVPEPVHRAIWQVNHPAAFARFGATRGRGILLTGPSGTGKTTMADYIAYHTGCPRMRESAASWLNVYVGTGAQGVKRAFGRADSTARAVDTSLRSMTPLQIREFAENLYGSAERLALIAGHARQPQPRSFVARAKAAFGRYLLGQHQQAGEGARVIKPIILNLDELDAVAGRRNAGPTASEHREDRRTVDELLNAFDCNKYPHVFVVATSNEDAWFFDPALVRPGRLEPIAIGLPEHEQRLGIIEVYLKNFAQYIDPALTIPTFLRYSALSIIASQSSGLAAAAAFWKYIVDRSEGFSGAELESIFSEASSRAATEYIDAEYRHSNGEARINPARYDRIKRKHVRDAFEYIMAKKLRSQYAQEAPHQGTSATHIDPVNPSAPRASTIFRRTGGSLGGSAGATAACSDLARAALARALHAAADEILGGVAPGQLTGEAIPATPLAVPTHLARAATLAFTETPINLSRRPRTSARDEDADETGHVGHVPAEVQQHNSHSPLSLFGNTTLHTTHAETTARISEGCRAPTGVSIAATSCDAHEEQGSSAAVRGERRGSQSRFSLSGGLRPTWSVTLGNEGSTTPVARVPSRGEQRETAR